MNEHLSFSDLKWTRICEISQRENDHQYDFTGSYEARVDYK